MEHEMLSSPVKGFNGSVSVAQYIMDEYCMDSLI